MASEQPQSNPVFALGGVSEGVVSALRSLGEAVSPQVDLSALLGFARGSGGRTIHTPPFNPEFRFGSPEPDLEDALSGWLADGKFKVKGKPVHKPPDGKGTRTELEQGDAEIETDKDGKVIVYCETFTAIIIAPCRKADNLRRYLMLLFHEWTHIALFSACYRQCVLDVLDKGVTDKELDKKRNDCFDECLKNWGSHGARGRKLPPGENIAQSVQRWIEDLYNALGLDASATVGSTTGIIIIALLNSLFPGFAKIQ